MKRGQNEAERWFERYLRNHGYEYEYEPDLGIRMKPDFRITRGEGVAVCEIKSFQSVPKLQKRLDTRQPVAAGTDEVYGPLRSAVAKRRRT
jgi:hypothetical protein